jgi:hypothetical protein
MWPSEKAAPKSGYAQMMCIAACTYVLMPNRSVAVIDDQFFYDWESNGGYA